jgi:acyl dehydratase
MSYLDTLHDYVGKDVGTSPWITIDQAKIDAHAAITGDSSWIHTDPERAASETPFGNSIAQGFLLLSCLTEMSKALKLPSDGVAYSLNYGFDRIRIVQPVPVDSRIRGHFELKKVESKGHHGVLAYLDASIEIEGDDIAPAVVAEWLAYMRLEDSH